MNTGKSACNDPIGGVGTRQAIPPDILTLATALRQTFGAEVKLRIVEWPDKLIGAVQYQQVLHATAGKPVQP